MSEVIAPKYLPIRVPVSFVLVVWLLLDRFKAAGWFRGAVLTLLALLVILTVYGFIKQTYVHPSELEEEE